MAGADKAPRSRIAAPHLDTQISYRLGVPLIYIRGELDHDSVGYLREAIDQELIGDPKALILEFSDLSYMDSGGLSLMFDTLARLKGKGWLGAVGLNPGVGRLLEITGLADHDGFRVFPDLHAASAALTRPEGD